jgi:hypothetical protein
VVQGLALASGCRGHRHPGAGACCSTCSRSWPC